MARPSSIILRETSNAISTVIAADESLGASPLSIAIAGDTLSGASPAIGQIDEPNVERSRNTCETDRAQLLVIVYAPSSCCDCVMPAFAGIEAIRKIGKRVDLQAAPVVQSDRARSRIANGVPHIGDHEIARRRSVITG